MIIRFVNKYYSVDPFPEIEVADFAVLTGLNGAGKSQLLEAIEKEQVQVDDIKSTEIVRYSNENFRIAGEPTVTGQSVADDALQSWNFMQQQLMPHEAGSINIIQSSPQDTVPTDPFVTYIARIRQFLNNNPNINNNPISFGVVRTIESLGKMMTQVIQKEYVEAYRPLDTNSGLLPRQLGKAFMDWRQKQIRNDVVKANNDRFKDAEPFLTDEEFDQQYGPAPWILVDSILSGFSSMQFETTKPDRADFFTSFKLQLKSKLDPNIIIDFESLSSGEKVLMALVALIYKNTQTSTFPKLVLLDEIDASLHPSMTRNLLSTIQEIFQSRGIKVMIVTHSPSTVALAPEGSIFVLNRIGANKIEKRTRSDALSILTEGFATLEEGIVVFDRSNTADISIISEGYNTLYISEALKHCHLNDVQVVENLEGMSGKNSLHTLFEFFCRVRHRAKIVVVWDCDANEMRRLTGNEETLPFVFAKNPDNTFITGGIENLLPVTLCEEFAEVVTVKSRFKDRESKKFDGDKRGLANTVKARNNPSDFANFDPLMALIRSLKVSTATTST